MTEANMDDWRKAQQQLPLIKNKKYRIECAFKGRFEGIYLGHDSCESFVENNVGAYFLYIDNNKIWSRNIISIEVLS